MNVTPVIGIYEKALTPVAWPEMLAAAGSAGFDFVELSIDETPERLARLDWSASERDELRRAVRTTGVRVPSLCLSCHRRYGLGSRDPQVRNTSIGMLEKAIRLADDIGVRIIQVAGYYAYYEEPDPDARARYVDGLAHGAACASRYGVMLAIENIDTADMPSAQAAAATATEIDSPWLRTYPDVGNMVVNGLDVTSDLPYLAGMAVGLHLKDARLGEPRRVPFGTGAVPFNDVFTELNRAGFDGPFMIEMWNDDPATANTVAAEALRWIRSAMTRATA